MMKMKYYALSIVVLLMPTIFLSRCSIMDNVKNSSNQMIDSFELEKYQWEINNYQINRNVGLVPDKDTAVNIAKKLWYEKYSETISYSEIEVCFDNKNECWHIFNTVEPDVLGGIFHVLIEKNGKVIAVWAED